MSETPRFWESKSLSEMSHKEWELLCDGCGYCCLVKLEDEDNPGHVYTTNIACRLLDIKNCRCKDYENRNTIVPGCMVIQHDNAEQFELLPDTCAYRRLHEGKSLSEWHPLLSGQQQTVVEAGISVCSQAICEEDVEPDDFQDYVFERIR